MNPAYVAVLIGSLLAALQALMLFVLVGLRSDNGETRELLGQLVRRVGEHEGWISAMRAQAIHGGHNGKR